MLSFISVAMVMLSLYKNGTLTKTGDGIKEQSIALIGLTLLFADEMCTLGLWIRKTIENLKWWLVDILSRT